MSEKRELFRGQPSSSSSSSSSSSNSDDDQVDPSQALIRKFASQNKAATHEENKLAQHLMSVDDESDFESTDEDEHDDSDDLGYPHADFVHDLLFDTDDSGDIFDDNVDMNFFDDFSDRPEELSEQEATLLALLSQALFTSTDKAAVYVGKVANAARRGTNRPGKLISSTNINTMKRKVLRDFNPIPDKYFYANCGKALVGPFNDRNKKVPQRCNLDHLECTINDSIREIKNGQPYFCTISVKPWLEFIIQAWFKKLRLGSANLTAGRAKLHDLPDCTRYRVLVPATPSDGVETLTLTLGWDGVNYTDDGKSLWPLVVYLNELPFNLRINLPMLVGVQVGEPPKASDQDLMLQPLIDELIPYATEPIEITVDGTVHKFLVKLLLVVADGPARAKVKNCHGHQGIYGCHMCKHKGVKDEKFNSMTFKTTSATIETDRLFTNPEWRSLAKDASPDKPLYGIKGVCQLMKLDNVDMGLIAPPECLHAVYLGCVGGILDRWFAIDLKGKAWYRDECKSMPKGSSQKVAKTNRQPNVYNRDKIGKEATTELDSRLASIKFPSRVLRRMPQFSSRKGSLKAIEYELILLYGWVCFDGLVKQDRLDNFKSLAFVISMLSARYIPENLRQVKAELASFLDTFAKIYGPKERFMFRLQIHYLSHLVEMVKAYGPLLVWSAYFTESTMGIVSRQVKSGTNVPQQVINKYVTSLSVVIACLKMLETCSKPFLEIIEFYYPNLCPKPETNPDLITPAKVSQSTPLSKSDLEIISKFPELQQSVNLKKLSRVYWKGQILCTKEYNDTKALTTNNHCIKTKSPNSNSCNYFIIHRIFQTDSSIMIFGKELCNSLPLPLNPNSKWRMNFSYISTFTNVSPTVTKLIPSNFVELATYTTIVTTNIPNRSVTKNYIFDLFSKHG